MGNGSVTALPRWTNVAAVEPRVVGKQPLEPQLSALGDVNLDDNGFYQHLRTTNIEPGNNRLQRCHLIGIGSDDEAVCALVRLDG